MSNNIYITVTAICMLILVAIMAPNILALNRGKILRNIAIWLAIFAMLGLFYQYFVAPGHPGMAIFPGASQQQEAPSPAAVQNSGDKGYTPPKE
jgi:hypothetical protein